MKRRYRAVGAAERALRLQCEARASMLTSVCIREYSAAMRAPILLRCRFQDGTSTDWGVVYKTDVSAVKMAIAWYGRNHELPDDGVRLHVVQGDDAEVRPILQHPPTQGVGHAMLSAMPRMRLGDLEVKRLAANGVEACMYCLEDLTEGDEILAFPCPGAHLAHADCSAQWLTTAHTCPVCRFDLPRDLTPRTLGGLVAPARDKLSRTAAALPSPAHDVTVRPPCDVVLLDVGEQPAEDYEAEEVDELRQLLLRGVPSQRDRSVSHPAG